MNGEKIIKVLGQILIAATGAYIAIKINESWGMSKIAAPAKEK